MKRVIVCLGMLVAILVILGCSSTRKLVTDKQPSNNEEKATGIVNEFFDPLILDEEDLKVKKTAAIESKSDQIKEEAAPGDAEFQKQGTSQGFRVQICALSDEERAKEIQRDAILKFINEEVYLIYDSPYYKVRVGNCLTRQEADKLQQFAVEKGFDDAWVVRTKITLKSKEY